MPVCLGGADEMGAGRSFGVLLAEIITGEQPNKRYGLRPARCASTGGLNE